MVAGGASPREGRGPPVIEPRSGGKRTSFLPPLSGSGHFHHTHHRGLAPPATVFMALRVEAFDRHPCLSKAYRKQAGSLFYLFSFTYGWP